MFFGMSSVMSSHVSVPLEKTDLVFNTYIFMLTLRNGYKIIHKLAFKTRRHRWIGFAILSLLSYYITNCETFLVLQVFWGFAGSEWAGTDHVHTCITAKSGPFAHKHDLWSLNTEENFIKKINLLFCLHYVCVMCIHTHACIYLRKNVYILNIFIYNINDSNTNIYCMCVYLYIHNKYTQYTCMLCKLTFILDAINHY